MLAIMSYNVWLLIGGVLGMVVGAQIFETDVPKLNKYSKCQNLSSTASVHHHCQNYGSVPRDQASVPVTLNRDNQESLRDNNDTNSDKVVVVSAEVHG